MRAKHTALILTAGFLLIPTMSWSQYPGMGGPGGGDRGAGGPGGGRMGGMSNLDPDMIFNMMSGGKDVFYVDQLPPQFKGMYERFAPMMGITGNEVTREQYRGAMTKVKEMAASGQLNGMSFRSASPGGPGGGGFSMPGTMNLGGGGLSESDRRTEDAFRRMDRDEDGNLQYDEMSETLQNDREKYDTNHDGMVDLTEFKAYVAARFAPQDGGAGRPGGPDGPKQPGDDDEKKRPTIIRAGNLPRDFPYAVLDQQGDNDGQVGLYEWKKSGKIIKEFVTMDLNNDGFLTVDEYYRWRKQGEDAARASGSMSTAFGPGGGRPGFGMGQPGMMDWGASVKRDLPPGSEMPVGGGRTFPGMGGPGAGMPSMNFQGMGQGRPGGDRGMGGDRGPGGDRFGSGERGQGGDRFGGGERGSGGDRGPGGDRFGGGERGQGGDRGPGMGGDRGVTGRFGGFTPGAMPPGAGAPGSGMTPPSRFGPGAGSFTPGAGMSPPAGIAIPGAPQGGDRGQGGERGNRGQRGQAGEGGGDRQPKGKR